MRNHFEASIAEHKRLGGKIEVRAKMEVNTLEQLSIAYTPGVAGPCLAIKDDPRKARSLTIKCNSVAVVTDGSAVLGLGNIGPLAAIPVMEGKALLFKQYGGVDAWPICLDTQDTQEIIKTIRHIAPVFGGINLEDISAPRCFEIEEALQDLGIPVFHDDQHGTAIAVMAALVNAYKVLGKDLRKARVVISGSGAAGVAIAKLLKKVNAKDSVLPSVGDVIVCDSKGALSRDRKDLNAVKRNLLNFTNLENRSGSLKQMLEGAHVFIGVSAGNLLTEQDIRKMAKESVVLALANPIPEILPAEAIRGGAAIVGTGRGDFPNQVNNALVFPGIFRGALDAGATRITMGMMLAAAHALVDAVDEPSDDYILPGTLDGEIAYKVGKAVAAAVMKDERL